YFLAQDRLDDLLQYYKELSALPRDMEIDETVLLDCFGRAFGLMDGNGKLDRVKLQNLAREWTSKMTYTPLEIQFEVKDILQQMAEDLKKFKEQLRNQQGVPGVVGAQPGRGPQRPRPGAAPKKSDSGGGN